VLVDRRGGQLWPWRNFLTSEEAQELSEIEEKVKGLRSELGELQEARRAIQARCSKRAQGEAARRALEYQKDRGRCFEP
jgi:hypothetical protein